MVIFLVINTPYLSIQFIKNFASLLHPEEHVLEVFKWLCSRKRLKLNSREEAVPLFPQSKAPPIKDSESLMGFWRVLSF